MPPETAKICASFFRQALGVSAAVFLLAEFCLDFLWLTANCCCQSNKISAESLYKCMPRRTEDQANVSISSRYHLRSVERRQHGCSINSISNWFPRPGFSHHMLTLDFLCMNLFVPTNSKYAVNSVKLTSKDIFDVSWIAVALRKIRLDRL